MKNSGKNLVILGILAVTIALTTTTVSLAVYHNSGDIYLDRSRPGFLPDEDEPKLPKTDNEYYFYEGEGAITDEEIEEYLINLEESRKNLDAVPDPYSASSLSDENLNISTEEKLVPAE